MAKHSSKSLILNVCSRLFQPVNIIPLNASKNTEKVFSKSQKLMVDLGIIKPANNGVHHILPLGIRSLEKLKNIIKYEMSTILAQEIKLPYLIDSNLWKKSGRLNAEGLGVFSLQDKQGKDFILSPTNEELAADLIANIPQFSHHQMPLMLYQISTKFRDEIKPRCGLIKSKEFEMKDLYSFDKCLESAKLTYQLVTQSYYNIFDRIGVPIKRVNAETGDMKGILSHEFHIESDLGEDILTTCNKCSYSFNSESTDTCPNCNDRSLKKVKGIEVGHTFLLGSVYSEALNTNFMSASGEILPVIMASYGLGLTRILAASVEHLSTEEDLVWPYHVSPFSVAIITPKDGSKEFQMGYKLGTEIYLKLNQMPQFCDDVLLDDRGKMTIGKRLHWAKRSGYPYVIVSGAKATATPPVFEIHDIKNKTVNLFSLEGIVDFLTEQHESGQSLLKTFST